MRRGEKRDKEHLLYESSDAENLPQNEGTVVVLARRPTKVASPAQQEISDLSKGIYAHVVM